MPKISRTKMLAVAEYIDIINNNIKKWENELRNCMQSNNSNNSSGIIDHTVSNNETQDINSGLSETESDNSSSSVSSDVLQKSIKKCTSPQEQREVYSNCRTFTNETLDNCKIARNKATAAESSSDLSSQFDADISEKRKRKRTSNNNIISSESSSDESQKWPSPPSIQNHVPKRRKVNDEKERIGELTTEMTYTKNIIGENLEKIIGTQAKMMTKIRGMQTMLMQLRNDVEKLKSQSSPSNNHFAERDEVSIFRALPLPVTTLEDLEDLEKYLQVEGNMRKSQIDFSTIGGNDSSDYVKRALMKLMTDEVYKEFNWEGLKGKRSIKGLKSVELILGGLKLSQNMQDQKTGEILIKNYIRHATERIRQRKQKELIVNN